MSKIKIGAQVTAKVCPTKVTVSGTFQGYELQDQEDPTSVCGKVFYVKDGMQCLDFVYVDSIKVCESEDERIIKIIKRQMCHGAATPTDEERAMVDAWLEKQKERHDDAWSEDDEEKVKAMCEEGNLKPSEREWLKNLKYRLHKEQKPVDRGKELSLSLQIQSYLNTASDELYAKGKPLYSDYRIKDIHECMKMWQRLHNAYFYNKAEQKPAEWSEEDEEIADEINAALRLSVEIDESALFPGSKNSVREAMTWLKSLRPRHHWKPSEEEMGALNYAYCELFKRGDIGDNILGPLQNLIDILRKL